MARDLPFWLSDHRSPDLPTTPGGGGLQASGNDYTYDAWGNLTNKTIKQNPTASCAGELLNRADSTTRSGVTTTFVYDADGNRVKKTTSGGATTLYWYLTPGIVGESDLAGTMKSEYVFFNGERVARRDLVAPTGVFYYFYDHLKTASVITDSAGVIKADSDYYPWGGELQFVNADSNHYKFTGKERDTETNLDYFGARYYSNGLGRFITPDWSMTPVPVPYADFGDPQSFNQYAYVRNIPTAMFDTDGHWPTLLSPHTMEGIEQLVEQGAKEGGKLIARAAAVATVARVAVGAGILGVAYAASPYIQTVGQSNADEIAERDRLDAENAQKLGHASGAGEDKSQSDIARDRARTNGGFAYENPGHHDPTSPNFVPGKTPLPTDAVKTGDRRNVFC